MSSQNQNKSAEQVATAKQAEVDRKAELAMEADLKDVLSKAENNTGDDDAFNELSNSDLVDVIAESVEKAMEAKFAQAQDGVGVKLEETNAGIQKLYGMIGKMQAKSQLADLRGSNKDFETYREDTVEVLKKYPMMEIPDAFALAKSKRKGDAPPAIETETERPGAGLIQYNDDGSMVRQKPTTKRLENRDDEPAPGTVKIRDIIRRGVDRAIKDRK